MNKVRITAIRQTVYPEWMDEKPDERNDQLQ